MQDKIWRRPKLDATIQGLTFPCGRAARARLYDVSRNLHGGVCETLSSDDGDELMRRTGTTGCERVAEKQVKAEVEEEDKDERVGGLRKVSAVSSPCRTYVP